jgi:hypothetical protein
MDESEWRSLAALAIEELDEIPLDERTRSRLEADLLEALKMPEGSAKSTIRSLLTSTETLRAWLDTKVDGDSLKSGRVLTVKGDIEGAVAVGGDRHIVAPGRDVAIPDEDEGWKPSEGRGPDVGSSTHPDYEDGAEDAVVCEPPPALPPRPLPSAAPPPSVEPLSARWSPLRSLRRIVLGRGGVAEGDEAPSASPPGTQPVQPDTGTEEETADGSRDERRKWLIHVEDYDQGSGLTVGEERVVTLGVGRAASATVADEFDDDFMDSAPDIQLFVLTVQVASEDFVIPDEDSVQTLQVPRTGPSRKPVTWRVTPRHEGPCTLTATVDYRGNFLTQLVLTVPADQPGVVELTTNGRSPESVATLEPRDLLLVVRPAPPGYDLTVSGSVYTSAHLPITDTELAFVVDDVQKALFEVVSMTSDRGELDFQYGIDIPEDTASRALEILAQAGALLFNQLFFHADSGEDLQEVGRFLQVQANQPEIRLKIMIVSADAPVPWPMLYLGDTADGAELSWNKFLGLQHIIDQVPRQRQLAVHDPKIRSDPQLSVGLNVNITIDQQFDVTWVGDHRSRWKELAGKRERISLFPRSTGPSVVDALDDADVNDQIVYFLCHATSGGTGGNPGDATLDMGQGAPITLRELQSVRPQTRFSANPLIFINACESSDLSPKFYAGFVPFFLAKGARGVIGTECKVPVVFAVEFAERFFDRLLDGKQVGDSVLAVRRELVEQHRNPLGLMYAVHCDADTRIDPALLATSR